MIIDVEKIQAREKRIAWAKFRREKILSLRGTGRKNIRKALADFGADRIPGLPTRLIRVKNLTPTQFYRIS